MPYATVHPHINGIQLRKEAERQAAAEEAKMAAAAARDRAERLSRQQV